MRTMDFSPLFRHSVGFDRMQQLLDHAARWDTSNQGYPPYNIEHYGENDYRITMAMAGFAEDDLDVTVSENTLIVAGKHEEDEKEDVTFLHRGIASRAFERRFELADNIRVTGANLVNGLLHIDLVREVPEEAKPRKIEIQRAAPSKTKTIEQKKAA